jgi:hypothetical protein
MIPESRRLSGDHAPVEKMRKTGVSNVISLEPAGQLLQTLMVSRPYEKTKS